MEKNTAEIDEQFNMRRKALEAKQANKNVLNELNNLLGNIKK